MAKILQFPTNAGDSRFTSEAWRLWEGIPAEVRDLLLNNAYCSRCKAATTIMNHRGIVHDGSLVLRGRCKHCGSEVARGVN